MRTDMKPYPLLDIHGTWREMGVQYGVDAKEEIGRTIEWWKTLLEKSMPGFTLEKGCEESVSRYLPSAKRHCPDCVEFLEGISEGSGFPFESILFINAASELMGGSSDLASSQVLGCTSFAIDGAHTEDGRAYIGQNLDWHPNMDNVVIRFRPADGPAFMAVTQAGLTAQIGVSENGFAHCCNSILRDERADGAIMFFMCQEALRSDTMWAGMDAVAGMPAAMSFNHIFCDKDGSMLDIECTVSGVGIVEKQDGIIVHTNHFLTPYYQEKDLGKMFTDTFVRRTQVLGDLSSRAKMSLVDIKAALSAHQSDITRSTCAHADPGVEWYEAYETVFSCIISPEDGIMRISETPCQDEYAEYLLK